MSDITELFSRVAPTDAEPSTETVEADLARGQRALTRAHRQRAIRRAMAATTTVAAAAVVVLVASQLDGSSSETHHAILTGPVTGATKAARHPTVSKPPVHRVTAIKLVDYTGKQLAGFTVDKVPDGWSLSTSTQYALLIDPKGDKDNDPDAFVGKLAVLTQSRDEPGLPKGTPVTVNGEAGVVTGQGKYGISLTYNTPTLGVVIQAPPQLAWTDQQIVAFAEGVHVTNDAVASRG
jgi:hypothetical protein